ncbi:NUDIX domain-containing protein [Minwuia sp.]|uniref:NUDIX domain-containing protein n=1 Tax=Minwuia sp. TaxID=2493630 RepID=UPI003A93C332
MGTAETGEAGEHHFPAVTTDIVVFRPAPRGRKILLIRRANPPFRGCWALPGGFLDADETLEQCAIRELQEETGISAADLQLVGVYSTPDRDPRGRTVSVAYAVTLDADRDTVHARSDAAEAAWFDLADLPDLAFDHDRIISDASGPG